MGFTTAGLSAFARAEKYHLTHDPKFKSAKDVTICHSLDEAIALADNNIEKIFIIGGQSL